MKRPIERPASVSHAWHGVLAAAGVAVASTLFLGGSTEPVIGSQSGHGVAVASLLLGGASPGERDDAVAATRQATPEAAREWAAAAKVEACKGKIRKDDKGRVSMIFFFEKSGEALLDEDIETIDFAPFTNVRDLFIVGKKLTDRSLARLEKIQGLKSCMLQIPKITDDGLAKFLAKQESLRSLTITGSSEGDAKITDKSMQAIAKLEGLTALAITNSPITDKGVAEIVGLKDVFTLNLSGTKISDAGLAEIAKMERLWVLQLSRTKITDKGLLSLGALRWLTVLRVSETAVTAEGKAALKALRPGLTIDD